jgi:hypothetical protein
MTDEMKIARRVQKNLRRSGIASEITMKDDMTLVSGKDRKGEPFAIRLRRCAGMDELDAFADECDELRTNPRKSGDLILVRQSDA